MNSDSPATTSMLVLFARVFWLMFGPVILLVIALNIVWHGGGWFTLMDITFLVVLFGLSLARWEEFRGGNPLTSTGEPANSGHLRRYAIAVTLIGLTVWILANLLGNHWITR